MRPSPTYCYEIVEEERKLDHLQASFAFRNCSLMSLVVNSIVVGILRQLRNMHRASCKKYIANQFYDRTKIENRRIILFFFRSDVNKTTGSL